MIPKIIHYCWVGGGPKPPSVLRCIESWRAHCPDYEIREWNEDNYDVTKHAYMRQAYEAKKWSFVTDYARLDIVLEHGGIYLDTDVELLRSLDELLDDECFVGFEAPEDRTPSVATGLGFGAVAGSEAIRRMRDIYDGVDFLEPDGSLNLQPAPGYTTAVLCAMGLVREDRDQRLPGVMVYASDVLCPMGFRSGQLHLSPRTVSIHRYDASWYTPREQKERRTMLRCKKLFGQTLGGKIGNAVNFARRRDGSFRQGVKYYLALPLVEISRRLPLTDTVVFETEGDFCDNGRALYEYMLSVGMDRRRHILWLVKEQEKFAGRARENVRFLRRDSLAARLAISRARYFFFTHPWWLKNWRRGQTVVSLWHGVPLKAGSGQDMSDTFDFFTASSPDTFELFHDFIGVRAEQYLPLGQPRLDLLLRDRDVSALLGGCVRGGDYEKLILCMPTFRQAAGWTDGAFANTYSINPIGTLEQLEALNDFLREEKLLLAVKIHHLQRLDFLERISLSNILYLTDEDLAERDVQLYEFVGQADCLLTDYSSIYFDYLLLNRPIGFFTGDMAQYDRGFVVDDPLKWMPGQRIETAEELRAFLQDVAAGRDEYGPKRKTILDRVDVYQDGDNCRRIAEHFHL